jgi:galactosamine-6-phosphate isomerase
MALNKSTESISFIVTRDYEDMSRAAALMLAGLLVDSPDASIIAATGASPSGTYRRLAGILGEQGLLPAKLRVIELDEWAGIPADHPGSCRTYLRTHLCRPLQIPESRCSWFEPDSPSPEEACAPVLAAITSFGPVKAAVLGIGVNGHIGLNEPGAALHPGTRLTLLEETTRQHSMLSASNAAVSSGYTLGMREILGAEHVLLLVSGASKGRALAALLAGTVDTRLPATLLHLHPNTVCFCDEAAWDTASVHRGGGSG